MIRKLSNLWILQAILKENEVLKARISNQEKELKRLQEAIFLIDLLELEFFDEAKKLANPHVSEPIMEKALTRKKRTPRKDLIQDLETEAISYLLPESKLTYPKCSIPLKKIHVESKSCLETNG